MSGKIISGGTVVSEYIALAKGQDTFLFDQNSSETKTPVFRVETGGSVLLMTSNLCSEIDLVRVAQSSASSKMSRTKDTCECTCTCVMGEAVQSEGKVTENGNWGLNSNRGIGVLTVPGLYYLVARDETQVGSFMVTAMPLSHEATEVQPDNIIFGG